MDVFRLGLFRALVFTISLENSPFSKKCTIYTISQTQACDIVSVAFLYCNIAAFFYIIFVQYFYIEHIFSAQLFLNKLVFTNFLQYRHNKSNVPWMWGACTPFA